MDTLTRIGIWFQSQCDGDWEHDHTINIFTLDNPGWGVTIDLENTQLQGFTFPRELIEKTESDWYSIKVENNVFSGHGDLMKLNTILERFLEIVDNHNN